MLISDLSSPPGRASGVLCNEGGEASCSDNSLGGRIRGVSHFGNTKGGMEVELVKASCGQIFCFSHYLSFMSRDIKFIIYFI